MADNIKGYIYISGTGTDPEQFNNMNDPLFGNTPTLGACMPNLREFVDPGDCLFVVSGSSPGVQQYIVGGMRVKEKISALAAFGRFPENHLRIDENGLLQGNVVVDAHGQKHPLDRHKDDGFDRRIKNFIVGEKSVSLDSQREVELGRQRSLTKLSELFGKPGNRAIDIIGRQSKLDADQAKNLFDWLGEIKSDAK
jgi:hypothetical protein